MRSPAGPAFGGAPPIGPDEPLRRLFAPYNLLSLNYLAANYCENLLDCRSNVLSYTHLQGDEAQSDAFHLRYPDDMGRFMEGLAWEAEYSPVVRLELMRRMALGLIASHVPGTRGRYFFRRRTGGKVFLLQTDAATHRDGAVALANLQDYNESLVRIGLEAAHRGERLDGAFARISEFPAGASSPAMARQPQHWNASPYTYSRQYVWGAVRADLECSVWPSDEGRIPQCEVRSKDADQICLRIGDPESGIAMLRDSAAPGLIFLPDGRTVRSDVDGNWSDDYPKYRYLLVAKRTAFGSWGHLAGLLILWTGRPERVEARKEHGFGQIRITFGRRNHRVWGRVSLLPFTMFSDADLSMIHRNAERLVAHGVTALNGHPMQELQNAAAAGLSAAAYLLTRYRDPAGDMVRVHARHAVDTLHDDDTQGMQLIRVYFALRAAAWLLKAARAAGDRALASRCDRMVSQWMDRMVTARHGYDGTGWASGWEHFNAMKAVWLAYEATGRDACRRIWERALTVYTIDSHAIYRYGVPLDAPGGFDTYAGALPLAIWGHAGMSEHVDRLIHLDAPNGWHDPQRPLKEVWNDTGAGPWACCDAGPDYVGFSLRGANLPHRRQWVIPVGAFPVYRQDGSVRITEARVIDNPYFLPGAPSSRQVDPQRIPPKRQMSQHVIIPGSKAEETILAHSSGRVRRGCRTCVGRQSVVYRLPLADSGHASLHLFMRGPGYQVDASPDGDRWHTCLDTLSEGISEQAIDLSFLTGRPDQLLPVVSLHPINDWRSLIGYTGVVEYGRRYASPRGQLTYCMDMQQVVLCRLEVMLGNGYVLECSADGRRWRQELCADERIGGDEVAWIRMVDMTGYLNPTGRVFVRLRDTGGCYRRPAFVQRITAYGAYRSESAWVRIANTEAAERVSVHRLLFRRWEADL